MTRYENLKDQPKKFLSLTGYTLQEFATLLQYFSQQFLAYVKIKFLFPHVSLYFRIFRGTFARKLGINS